MIQGLKRPSPSLSLSTHCFLYYYYYYPIVLSLSAVLAVCHLTHPQHSWSKSTITNTRNILKSQLVIRHNRKGDISAWSFVCGVCDKGDGSSNVLNPVTEALRVSATEPQKTNYTHFSCSYIHQIFLLLSAHCSLSSWPFHLSCICFISNLFLHIMCPTYVSFIFRPPLPSTLCFSLTTFISKLDVLSCLWAALLFFQLWETTWNSI